MTLRLLLLALLTAAFCAPQPQSKQRIEWNRPIAPFHIIGNIYYVGTAQLGSYLIATRAGEILLDGALPESAPQIEKHITALGFRVRDVKILLNTHAHYDHDGGLRELKRASRAQMIASRGDAPDLESGLTESFGAGWDQRTSGVKVDRLIDDGAQVSLGGTVMTAHVMPGHTRGCTTWTTIAQEAGKTYHVVFYCSTSVPGYPLVNNRSYPNIARDYQKSFAIAEALPCDVFLANHAEFFHMHDKLSHMRAGKANPFIDPGEYQAFVADSKRQFEAKLHSQQTPGRHTPG